MENEASVSDKGTELEKIQADQTIQDQVFSDAFDAAEKLPDDHVIIDNDDGKDTKQDAVDRGKVNADSKADTKTDAKVDANGTVDAKKDDKAKTDDKATNQNEDFEQKWKSLNGIIKSKDEKYAADRAELLAEVDSLKKTISELTGKIDNKKGKGAADSSSIFDDLDDATKSALEEYEKDFDSVSKMEGLKREKALTKLKAEILEEFGNKTKEILDQLATRVSPLEKTIEESNTVSHFSSIREKHSDFETYRDDGSILKWIETKPKYMQEAMKAVYMEGSAGDVIDLISDFKLENNLLEDNNNGSSSAIADNERRKAEKKQNLTAVVTKRSPVSTLHAVPTGYEEAFEEATKKLQ